MSHPAYDELTTTWRRLHHFSHLQALASWDRAALMPANGNTARANAMAEMDGLLHRIRTDPRLAAALELAPGESLDDLQRANLREIRHDWRSANALPEALVQAQSLAIARCEHAWRTQRPANDWAGFLANFREVLKLAREQSRRLADHTGLKPYDALMDNHEPGMTGEILDPLFGDLQQWLPDLARKVREKQARETVLAPAAWTRARIRFAVACRKIPVSPPAIATMILWGACGASSTRPAMGAMSRVCRATGSASRSHGRGARGFTKVRASVSRCRSA